MVSRNISITTASTKSASITTSVSEGVSVDATIDESPYADIVATSPTLFVPLKYASTSEDGQILFEDAACTIPVTDPGDPVGGVKWDGTIVATQSTDANRPVWQGEAVGVQADGVDQYFELAASGVSGSSNRTILGVVRFDGVESTPSGEHVFTLGESGGVGEEYRLLLFNGNHTLAISGDSYETSLGFPATKQFWGVRMDGTTIGDHRFYLGDLTEDSSGATAINTIDVDNRLFRGQGSKEGEFTIGEIAVWDRALSDAEIATVKAGMEARH